MVKTAETYVVSSAVAGNDPLAALNDEVLKLKYTIADITSACLAQRHKLISDLTCGSIVLTVFKPLCGKGLDLITALVAVLCGSHEVGKA